MTIARLNLKHNLILAIMVPLLCQVITVAVLLGWQQHIRAQLSQAERSRALLSTLTDIHKLMYDALSDSFVYLKTGSAAMFKSTEEKSETIEKELNQLMVLMRDRKSNDATFFQQTVKDVLRLLKSALLGNRSIANSSHTQQLMLLEEKVDNAVNTGKRLADHERSLCSSDSIESSDTLYSRLIWAYVALSVVSSCVVALTLALFFYRGVIKSLSVLTDNISRLEHHKPLNDPLIGHDELCAVDRTFHEMANRLKEAAEIKNALVSALAHDVRTPITAGALLLNMLAKGVYGDQSEEAKKKLRVSIAELNKLGHLVDDLLDVYRDETKQSEAVLERVRLMPCLLNAAEAIEGWADFRKIKIEVKETTVNVMASPSQLDRVLSNLLSNAIKYSAKGATIIIETIELDEYAEIRVIDQGKGIAESDITKLFQPFRRLDSAAASDQPGTGLGLAVAKRIVEQHGGSIGCHSTVGQGSTFWVRLRYAKIPID